MFNNFKKKIKFSCRDPYSCKLFPITETKKINFEWKKKLLQESKLEKEFLYKSYFHTCPGINSIHTLGWVIFCDRDVYIKTSSDGNIFWKVKYLGVQDYIDFHYPENFKHFSNWPSYTNRHVLKFNTPWFAEIPKNYYLLQLPISFQDEDRFVAVSGSYSHELGICPLTVPVFWQQTSEHETVIKAGTPLAQFILVKNETINLEFVNFNQEKLKLYNYLRSHKFKPNYFKNLSIFKKIFK